MCPNFCTYHNYYTFSILLKSTKSLILTKSAQTFAYNEVVILLDSILNPKLTISVNVKNVNFESKHKLSAVNYIDIMNLDFNTLINLGSVRCKADKATKKHDVRICLLNSLIKSHLNNVHKGGVRE